MNPLLRLCSRAWIPVLLMSLAFVWRTTSVHLARAEQLSNLAGGDALVADAASVTGYAGGVRKLVLPESHPDALQWIGQTQEALARGEWRVRRIASDNAPIGRTTLTPSPYRWWLAAVAGVDRIVSGDNRGASVERAALLAGPALLGLLLLTATPFVARYFGGLSAALLAGSLALGFPLAGNFLTPLPNDRALAQFLAVWTVLPLLAAIAGRGEAIARVGFPLAAIFGAALLWVNAGAAVLVLLGVLLGGVAAAWWSRVIVRDDGSIVPAGTFSGMALVPPWRQWSWVGAAATVLAWLAEYAPAQLGAWRLDFIHPLHALAWIGAAELLHAASMRWLMEDPPRGGRVWLGVGFGFAAVLALPVAAIFSDGFGLFGPAARTTRLTFLPGETDVAHLFAWLRQASASGIFILLMPLALLPVASNRVKRARNEPAIRAGTLIALAIASVALLAGVGRVGLWWVAGSALTGLVVVLTAESPHRGIFSGLAWSLAAVCTLIPGLDVLSPAAPKRDTPDLSAEQFEALLHRDLAHWIARRAPAGGAIVLAPPATTSALIHFGGVRGLGTPDPENQEGFGAAVRICGTSSTDEAMSLVQKRGVTHLVVPSWDGFLDEYARLGNNQPEKSLVSLLHQWLPPRWLRPVAYALPQTEGIGDRTVFVFETCEVQEPALSLARLAEYFVEMNQPELAGQVAAALANNYPDDPGGLIARALVSGARGDGAEFNRVFRALKPMLDSGEDADWPWERRAMLALILAQAKQTELARPRVVACVASSDESRLRELTPLSLYRLQVLAKAYSAGFPDAATRERAQALLPPELREQL